MATCSDGVKNQSETGIDCGPGCDACPLPDPTVSAPSPLISESEVLSVYCDTYTTNTVANYVFQDFTGSGPNSEVDIESDGNMTAKIENLNYYGSVFTAIDLSIEESPGVSKYDFVHFDYYATSSTLIQFYVIDANTPCCGSSEEPRYVIDLAGGGDETLVQGSWQSVFIPLSVFANFAANNGAAWDGIPVSQIKFEGNGNFFYDNIYFSKNNFVLSSDDLEISEFSLYPNPTQNRWTVKTKNINMTSIKVFDILGKNVISMLPNSDNVKIDGSSLKRGMYFAQIKTVNGVNSIKLIKQ
ncbi:T9SS type A sorting domain-containing protein [Thalassobellus suaedae]|uniref:T9SS type A sorting domain-containing protein n=1 Tax=Thalassobellus suaedae TaxID=3074124 RepID=A0ABY9Y7B2_9FLAO|nr:T9SS type A sorting domain-containing protein [Flavobacteriaceae bacterium HL-DH10]